MTHLCWHPRIEGATLATGWDGSVVRESVMKKLLLGVAIAMIVISSASAGMGDGIGGSEFCKGCPSWRSPASSDPPPWWLTPSPVSACRLVKERVGTRRGHAVYETRQVCG
jgi:hypothetical protein